MATAKRLYYYDNLKYILITLVVVGHFIEPFMSESHAMTAVRDWIYLFHMPAFLFVGGMFSKKIYTKERGLRLNTIAFYLLMFFLFYTSLWLWKHLYNPNPEYNLISVGSIPWYFFTMATLSLATPVLEKVRGGWKTIVPISIGVAVLVGFSNSFNDFLCLGRTFVYAPFYFAGYYLGINEYKEFIAKLQSKIWPIVLAISFLVGVFCFCWMAPNDLLKTMAMIATAHNPYKMLDVYPSTIDAVLRMIDIALAFAMVLALSVIVPTGKTFYSEMGSRTLQVYLLHPFIYCLLNGFGIFEHSAAYLPWAGVAYLAAGIILTGILAKPKTINVVLEKFKKSIQVERANC